MTFPPAPAQAPRAFSYHDHARRLDQNLYVYAVLSRRAKGLSIGINLNPDKVCNFDCVYCQVDRREPSALREVDEARVLEELSDVLAATDVLLARAAGEGVPEPLRRVADVAFSGDGEPTSYPRFAELLEEVGRVIDTRLPGTPMTLITNATLFHLPRVERGLGALAARGGTVWAKLDAGTEAAYRAINGSRVPFARVLDNIREEALRRPLVVQSLFLRRGAHEPDDAEVGAYAARLADIVDAGGRIKGVQVTTVARRPPHADVLPLSRARLEAIVRLIEQAVPGVPVEAFPAAFEGTPPWAAAGEAG